MSEHTKGGPEWFRRMARVAEVDAAFFSDAYNLGYYDCSQRNGLSTSRTPAPGAEPVADAPVIDTRASGPVTCAIMDALVKASSLTPQTKPSVRRRQWLRWAHEAAIEIDRRIRNPDSTARFHTDCIPCRHGGDE